MTDPTTDATHTAYPSGPDGLWTVWDHRSDQLVRDGLDEDQAVRLAAEMCAAEQ